MDNESAEKERQNAKFTREELGALLKLFSSLGITVAVCILGFFWLGLYFERKASEAGMAAHGLIRTVFVIAGVGVSVYWAYLRIARHLEKYDDESKTGSVGDDNHGR